MAVFVVDAPTDQRKEALSTVAPPLILSRLRLETRSEHNAVEQVLDLMSTALTHDCYRQRLEQFYSFYAPLEQALRARAKRKCDEADELGLSPGTRSALACRLNKTALLRQDLHCLGVQAEHLLLCRYLPPLETQAEVLGCLYVMEGATLGGRLITQHVRATLGITPFTGSSFFESYGDDTIKMWQTMRQLLVAGAHNTPTENAIVANAIITFECLRRWCQSSQKHTTTEMISYA